MDLAVADYDQVARIDPQLVAGYGHEAHADAYEEKVRFVLNRSLIGAAEEDQAEMASKLVSRGANVNARSEDGSTVLMIASAQGRTEVINILISASAD